MKDKQLTPEQLRQQIAEAKSYINMTSADVETLRQQQEKLDLELASKKNRLRSYQAILEAKTYQLNQLQPSNKIPVHEELLNAQINAN